MGSAGPARGASRLGALSPVAEAVAVASAAHAAPDGEDVGAPAVGRYVLHTLSRGVCHPRAKRGCPGTVSESGAVSGHICGASADLAPAHRPLGWPAGHVSLAVA